MDILLRGKLWWFCSVFCVVDDANSFFSINFLFLSFVVFVSGFVLFVCYFFLVLIGFVVFLWREVFAALLF